MRREAAGLLACAAVLIAIGFVVPDAYGRHIIIMSCIYAIVAASWDLSLGYGGIFNFGHLALFGIGVYAYALLTKVVGLAPWIALPGAAVVAMLAAVVVTVPILRLKGIYIILVSFGFTQLVMQLILSQSTYTGGTSGLVRIPGLTLGAHDMLRDFKLAYLWLALGLLLVTVVSLRVLVRSRLGASIVALRDNEEYAVSRGVSLVRQRLLTLAASALPAGLAGAFYAAYQRNASIDVFGASLSTMVLSMVLLGGAATIYGPVLAAFVLTIFSEVVADLGPWRPMVTAVLIGVVMLFYPGGLAALLRAGWGRVSERRTSR